MSRRSSAIELAAVLDRSPYPLYVVDDNHEIVFCNRACAQLFQLKAADLIGQRCAYHSQGEDGSPNLTSMLCPPPETFTGQAVKAELTLIDTAGTGVHRSGLFLPLSDGADMSSPVLAILRSADEADSEFSERLADQLHEQLWALHRELKFRHGVQSIVGSSPAIVRARAQAMLAAKSGARALIVGPRGTGKEHLAKAIHYARSESTSGNLVALSCGLLSPELLSSTLKAMAARRELDRDRKIDTLLFHDLEQMPLEVQPQVLALLRASNPAIPVIATSSVGQADPLWQNSLNDQLLAHLSTLVIELPPLAQRVGDLPLLAQWFLEDVNRTSQKQVAHFSPDALHVLSSHEWPGNLDELAAIVREAHAQASTTTIEHADLPRWFQKAVTAQLNASKGDDRINLERFLSQIERELIERALRRARGNKSKAAALLGLNRPRLYRRMEQLGFDVEHKSPPKRRPPKRERKQPIGKQQ